MRTFWQWLKSLRWVWGKPGKGNITWPPDEIRWHQIDDLLDLEDPEDYH